MTKASTRGASSLAPLPPIPSRPTLAEAVFTLQERGEPEAAAFLVTRARRCGELDGEAVSEAELFAAQLVLERASIPGTRIVRRYAEAAGRAAVKTAVKR